MRRIINDSLSAVWTRPTKNACQAAFLEFEFSGVAEGVEDAEEEIG